MPRLRSTDARRTKTGTRPREAAEPLRAPSARSRGRREARPCGAPSTTSRSRCPSGAPSRRASSPTSGRRTPARPTTRSSSSTSRAEVSTPARCGCSRRRRTGASSAELGEERVGLVTGEERINEHAPILCCTVEMAPSSGEVLVLDEVQWADDPERGSAWTRLLLAGEFRHILLLGALDAEPLVLHALPAGRDQGVRAHAAARVRRRALAALAHAGHRRRRLQPQGGARARGRDQPPASGPCLGALRRDAARVPARGDRPLPGRRAPT